jgi:tripartite-type tricarboxylate transporter receptor subunit TctC
MNRRTFNMLMAAAAVTSAAGSARAQSDKPVSIVVGYSAGGSADLTARVVANELGKRLGRPVVVENVAGASGMLAVQKTLSAPPDGGIIYMGGTDTVVVPMVNPRVKHDWAKDFTPVGRMTTVPMLFAVPADAPYNTLGELVAALRKQGLNHFSYATPGIGTMQHFYGELINRNARVQMLHVPYRGGAQIVNDLIGRQLHGAVLVLSTALPHLKEGRIKALSVSGNERAPQLPNVKRIGEEEGFKGQALPLWQGLFVKAGTPAAIAGTYEKALLQALAAPEVVAKLQEGGITAAPMSGQQLKAFVSLQANIYRDIATAAKISLE